MCYYTISVMGRSINRTKGSKTMKTRKLRVIAGFVVVMLLLTVLATTALASSDFYESSFNGNSYICRSSYVYLSDTYPNHYFRGKLSCQESSYQKKVSLTVRYSLWGNQYTGGSTKTGYTDPCQASWYAQDETLINCSFKYYLQSTLLYSTYLTA